VACSNGTTAIHLAMESLGIGPDDEVIIPAFTLIVSANMVCLSGARPVPVDVRPDTWCIEPRCIEARLTSRTKAIMVVHMYGHPCDMEPILELAKRRKLYVIEDAAQAHGATYHGRTVGSFGDAACFSFYGNKIITTGEGGMLVTKDRRIAERAALLRNQAFGADRFVHQHLGYNYRMTNLQAAIGLGQCERIEEKVRRKREIARRYDEMLAEVAWIQRPVQADGCRNVYWMYGIVVDEAYGLDRDEVRRRLLEEGVETRSFFTPIHLQPLYQGGHRRCPDLRGSFPISEVLGKRGLYLPSGLSLTEDDQSYIVEQLLSCAP